MKKWIAPAVAELSIEETACGIFCTECELWPIINDNKADKSPSTPETEPTNPEETFS